MLGVEVQQEAHHSPASSVDMDGRGFGSDSAHENSDGGCHSARALAWQEHAALQHGLSSPASSRPTWSPQTCCSAAWICLAAEGPGRSASWAAGCS